MSTLPGSGVPSMTTLLPDGGVDFSAWVWMIFVGACWYCCSFACAVLTPPLVAADEDDEPLDELDESSDPHADTPAPRTIAPASASRGLTPRGHAALAMLRGFVMEPSSFRVAVPNRKN